MYKIAGFKNRILGNYQRKFFLPILNFTGLRILKITIINMPPPTTFESTENIQVWKMKNRTQSNESLYLYNRHTTHVC